MVPSIADLTSTYYRLCKWLVATDSDLASRYSQLNVSWYRSTQNPNTVTGNGIHRSQLLGLDNAHRQ